MNEDQYRDLYEKNRVEDNLPQTINLEAGDCQGPSVEIKDECFIMVLSREDMWVGLDKENGKWVVKANIPGTLQPVTDDDVEAQLNISFGLGSAVRNALHETNPEGSLQLADELEKMAGYVRMWVSK